MKEVKYIILTFYTRGYLVVEKLVHFVNFDYTVCSGRKAKRGCWEREPGCGFGFESDGEGYFCAVSLILSYKNGIRIQKLIIL